jgi:hypothetical protein
MGGLSTGGFAGIVVAAFVVMFLAVVGVYYRLVVTPRQRAKEEKTPFSKNVVQLDDSEVFNVFNPNTSSAPLGKGAERNDAYTPKADDYL